ncbi:MAG: xanthine dehydrogenase family protein molybdopterin-binding subunit, partial [Acidobacteriaceae bacterium]|nr:xanthine dehydrogenase family protein molybdopterin-binding subunit [Acidobacteriaceae bacterium]
MSATANALSRRTLLKNTVKTGATAGAVLAIGFDVTPAKASPEKAVVNPLKAWVKIDQTGAVTLVYSKSEMGQGVSTALPMILADELDVNWKDVRVEHAPVEPAFGGQGTGGSGSVASTWTPLRTAGATARLMLVTAAAQRWNVDPASCTAKNGAVWHGNQKLAYGELVESAAQLPVPDPATVRLKNPDEFNIIGKSFARTDVPAKTDGSAIFGIDVRVPGMLYAVVARCPVFGGKVKTFDAAKAKAMHGVRDIFEIPPVGQGVHSCGGIAVVADTTYIAMQARKQLQ